ncbi:MULTISPECIES: TspO/MBR family protein [Bradyrhizobium]|jgi:tryptophan-rich sensory protein|uniref:Tryptophan-rich sensory protein n=1 Tax=Bradyrhizobium barranii subsp. apii TaxID=2819348 RepID=A0A8T5UV91_9BRAD|nr:MULTISPECIES: TspO/MBR family protein [Bradyrhizobium]MCK1276043.1 tryptophan-rich sensory protein [Bradyrhizobium sp. 61]MCK1443166.1 tryptophan-rich sensory protein [Bradyrhizobium sp. 48]MCK1464895.1 tryptophan-rich sensory protein [Bradyrhizobium sp. 2]MCS3925609.1 tryptophan-rich sensory protein [Bradyrhizobium elkanii]MCS3975238.1 tryptophan-rich sensory protein [Bradyrhizobium japonicum]
MLQLLVFVVGVVGIGWLIGATNLPGEWYAALAKPGFVPPNWAFPVAWTILYIMIAVAGWRTFRREPSGRAMQVWAAQLALNFVWSPVMFTMHQIGAALVILICLFVAIVTYISLETSRDRLAAALFVPYAAWVAFAGLLNAAIWRLN